MKIRVEYKRVVENWETVILEVADNLSEAGMDWAICSQLGVVEPIEKVAPYEGFYWVGWAEVENE